MRLGRWSITGRFSSGPPVAVVAVGPTALEALSTFAACVRGNPAWHGVVRLDVAAVHGDDIAPAPAPEEAARAR